LRIQESNVLNRLNIESAPVLREIESEDKYVSMASKRLVLTADMNLHDSRVSSRKSKYILEQRKYEIELEKINNVVTHGEMLRNVELQKEILLLEKLRIEIDTMGIVRDSLKPSKKLPNFVTDMAPVYMSTRRSWFEYFTGYDHHQSEVFATMNFDQFEVILASKNKSLSDNWYYVLRRGFVQMIGFQKDFCSSHGFSHVSVLQVYPELVKILVNNFSSTTVDDKLFQQMQGQVLVETSVYMKRIDHSHINYSSIAYHTVVVAYQLLLQRKYQQQFYVGTKIPLN